MAKVFVVECGLRTLRIYNVLMSQKRERHVIQIQNMQLRRLFEVANIIDRKFAKDSSMFQLMTSEALNRHDCLVNKYFDTLMLGKFGC